MNSPELLAYCKYIGYDGKEKFMSECILTKYYNDIDNVDDLFISVDSPFGEACFQAISNNKHTFKASFTIYDVLESELYTNINKEDEIDLTNIEKSVMIIVCYGMMRCQKQQHNIESVTAKVSDIMTADLFYMNIQYCTECNIYFVHYKTLELFHKRGLYPNIRLYDGIHPLDNCHNSLSPKSTLNSYGYSTRIKETDRRKILLTILSQNLLSKHKIIQHIEWLLWFHQNNPRTQSARIYWKSDLVFVNEYMMDVQRNVYGNLDYRR